MVGSGVAWAVGISYSAQVNLQRIGQAVVPFHVPTDHTVVVATVIVVIHVVAF